MENFTTDGPVTSPADLGTTVNDEATVTGTPGVAVTGTVTYNFYTVGTGTALLLVLLVPALLALRRKMALIPLAR